MKRRELKKNINYLCGELFAECVAVLHYQKPQNRTDVDNVMLSILQMQNDLICRISHVEPGSTKLFFKKIHQEMIERSEEIANQIRELV